MNENGLVTFGTIDSVKWQLFFEKLQCLPDEIWPDELPDGSRMSRAITADALDQANVIEQFFN